MGRNGRMTGASDPRHRLHVAGSAPMIGKTMRQCLEEVLEMAGRRRKFKVHFATAREAFNIELHPWRWCRRGNARRVMPGSLEIRRELMEAGADLVFCFSDFVSIPPICFNGTSARFSDSRAPQAAARWHGASRF